MTCIKTGAQVYLQQHQKYMICDIHSFGSPNSDDLWILRGNPSWANTPIRDILHAEIIDIAEEWSGSPTTIVVAKFKYYGYEGAPCAK